MLLHNIPVDEQDKLVERLISIKKYGILACEWFGVRYEQNEVPFRVSFHRVPKTTKLSDVNFQPTFSSRKSKPASPINENNGILLIVDGENPELKKLINPAFVEEDYLVRNPGDENTRNERLNKKADKEAKQFAKTYIKNLEFLFDKNITSNYSPIDKNKYYNAINNLIKYYKDNGLEQFIHNGKLDLSADMNEVLNSLKLPTKSMLKSIYQKVYNTKFNSIVNALVEQTEYEENNFCYIYAGVPSCCIVGIVIPENLAKDEEFIKKVATIYPNAKILDNQGNLLINTKTNDITF